MSAKRGWQCSWRAWAIVSVLVLVGPLAGCGAKNGPAEPADSEAALAAGRAEQARQRVAAEQSGEGALGEGATVESLPAVRFAFDSFAVSAGERDKVRRAADYLKQNPDLRLRLEGHADERGSADYNMVLGQRRADSVRDVLAGFGVAASRVETMSYGEEFPVDPGQNEAAWSRNRRVEFVIQTP